MYTLGNISLWRYDACSRGLLQRKLHACHLSSTFKEYSVCRRTECTHRWWCRAQNWYPFVLQRLAYCWRPAGWLQISRASQQFLTGQWGLKLDRNSSEISSSIFPIHARRLRGARSNSSETLSSFARDENVISQKPCKPSLDCQFGRIHQASFLAATWSCIKATNACGSLHSQWCIFSLLVRDSEWCIFPLLVRDSQLWPRSWTPALLVWATRLLGELSVAAADLMPKDLLLVLYY